MIGISPHYIKLTRRFIQNAGPLSITALSADIGIPAEELEQFGETGELQAEKVMKVWVAVFQNLTFLEASVSMDKLGFQR